MTARHHLHKETTAQLVNWFIELDFSPIFQSDGKKIYPVKVFFITAKFLITLVKFFYTGEVDVTWANFLDS